MRRPIVYRAMLRLLPPATRERHGEEMALVFDELVRDARASGTLSVLRVSVREMSALARFA